MGDSMEERLRRVLEAHGLVCGALIHASGEVSDRVGDFDALAYGGVVSALLGPLGSPKTTFDWLEGQALPRMSIQGEDFAIMDRPRPHLAVVVFGRSGAPVLERMRLSREVAKTIAAEFAPGL